MGLDINSVQFLIDARRGGAELGEVVTFGRQDLNVFPARMVQLLERNGFPAEAFKGANQALYSEPAFLSLGARRVHSMDVSAFEGASFIHDLNLPIGPELKERFDTVYDGGTLEHVFNFPTALKNCMEMVKVGGRFFTHTVANNWCGHGFYQFSPELFHRTLNAENGYVIERMVAHRVGPYGTWYEVADPEKIHSRIELLSFTPVMLLIQARRTTVVPIFAKAPQQSDYSERWATQSASDSNPYAAPRPRLARVLPRIARLIHFAKMATRTYWNQSLWNRRAFRPVRKP